MPVPPAATITIAITAATTVLAASHALNEPRCRGCGDPGGGGGANREPGACAGAAAAAATGGTHVIVLSSSTGGVATAATGTVPVFASSRSRRNSDAVAYRCSGVL